MASAFAHIAIPAALYTIFKGEAVNFRLFLLGAFCAVIPDLDVIAFNFGIPYASQWGHRGFTHSLMFALGLAILISLFYQWLKAKPWTVFGFTWVSCISHPLLDAMTNGELGAALFWPFGQHRYFFPFRPIEVSPIGIGEFFTERGQVVIFSELLWIVMPLFLIAILGDWVRRQFTKQEHSQR
jgi:inner membrane protein